MTSKSYGALSQITEQDIITCLENTINLKVNGVFNKPLIGSLIVTWNDTIIKWILEENLVEVYWEGKCPIFGGTYNKPTTLEEWNKLFKESFDEVKTTIQKIEIHNIIFNPS